MWPQRDAMRVNDNKKKVYQKVKPVLDAGIHYVQENATHMSPRDILTFFQHAHSFCGKAAKMCLKGVNEDPVNPLDYVSFTSAVNLWCVKDQASNPRDRKYKNEIKGMLRLYWYSYKDLNTFHMVGMPDLVKALQKAKRMFRPKKSGYFFYKYNRY